ncbi:MAG TPA: HAD family hydrolase [Planctomycetota bacterium]|nr:HAD family hydrolase [Planctomycetota bacterium]
MIKYLLFDAGNTLVYLNMALVSETLSRHGARATPEELWRGEHRARALLDDPEIIRASTDQTRWVLYFETIFRFSGVSDQAVVAAVIRELQGIHKTNNLWEVVPPEVPRALDSLRGRFRFAVVSNANGTVRDKLRRVGLAGYFEVILDSHEEGVEKPDPRIFRIALERLGARAEEALHVGDFYHIDVVGARAAGVRAVLLDPGGSHHDKPVPRIETIEGLGPLVDAL